jgi:hypothetical protein
VNANTNGASGPESPTAPSSPERRRTRRARLELAARLHPYHPSPILSQEIRPTINVSRDGIYFSARRDAYRVGMHVLVSCPYSEADANIEGDLARVIRIDSLAKERWASRFSLCGA